MGNRQGPGGRNPHDRRPDRHHRWVGGLQRDVGGRAAARGCGGADQTGVSPAHPGRGARGADEHSARCDDRPVQPVYPGTPRDRAPESGLLAVPKAVMVAKFRCLGLPTATKLPMLPTLPPSTPPIIPVKPFEGGAAEEHGDAPVGEVGAAPPSLSADDVRALEELIIRNELSTEEL